MKKKYNNILITLGIIALVGVGVYIGFTQFPNKEPPEFLCDTHSVRVVGASMFPTLRNNEIHDFYKFGVDCSKNKFTFSNGDIVLLNISGFDDKFVKSIAAVPGDSIKLYKYVGDTYFIEHNGKSLTNRQGKRHVFSQNEYDLLSAYISEFEENRVPNNTYLFLGENTQSSRDARNFGFISGDAITGLLVKNE